MGFSKKKNIFIFLLVGWLMLLPIFFSLTPSIANHAISQIEHNQSIAVQTSTTNFNQEISNEIYNFKTKGINLEKQINVARDIQLVADGSYAKLAWFYIPKDVIIFKEKQDWSIDDFLESKFALNKNNQIVFSLLPNSNFASITANFPNLHERMQRDVNGYEVKLQFVPPNSSKTINLTTKKVLNTKDLYDYIKTSWFSFSSQTQSFWPYYDFSLFNNFAGQLYLKLSNVNRKKGSHYWIYPTKEQDFFNQIIYLFDKDEIINIFNFALTALNETQKQELESGPAIIDGDGNRAWNFGDLTNANMPPFITWNENMQTLLELEKICDLIENCNLWLNKVSTGSGWVNVIRDFINLINNKYFASYQEIAEIYNKYYKISINDTSNANAINDFNTLIAEMTLNYKDNNYVSNINTLNKDLTKNKITIPNFVVGTELTNLGTVTDTNQFWINYKVLSYLIKGALNSNDLLVDVDVSIPSGKKNSIKEVKIYSCTSNELNNEFLKNALVDVGLDGATIQTVNVKNFKIENKLSTKFFNLNSDDTDCSKFDALANNLTNIKINYNAAALDFYTFAYADWTKNQDAVGIDLNKYLSELINLSSDEDVEVWNFVDEEVKETLLRVLNGNYTYINNNNENVKVEMPMWLVSARSEFASNKTAAFSDLYAINNASVEMLLAQQLFSLDEWMQAWNTFGIGLDEKDNKYPLIQPNQSNGEFYAIVKIDKFHLSSNYTQILKSMQKTKKAPIVLINQDYVSNDANQNGDGYFLIKLKAAFDGNYDFNIANKRFYNLSQNVFNNEAITYTINKFIQNVLIDGGEKYWINHPTLVKKNDFFTSNSWVQANWTLNTNAIWEDLFNVESGLLTYSQVQAMETYFRQQINKELQPYIVEKYGVSSNEAKEFEQFQTNFEAYQQFYNLISDDDLTQIDYIPYIFNNEIWNYLDEFTKYSQITTMLQIPNLGAEQQEALKLELENNQYYQFLQLNAKNSSAAFTNEEINNFFQNAYMLQINLFADKYTNPNYEGDDKDYNVFKAELKAHFDAFKSNWNSPVDGMYSAGNIVLNGQVISFSEYLKWLQAQLEEIDITTKYAVEVKNIFINQFNDLITKMQSSVAFVVGNEVNNNLVFSSIEEMINDPLVKIIFKNQNIDVNQVFVQNPYTINGSIVPNAYTYTLNQDANFPFSINQKDINGVTYYVLNNAGNSLKMNLSLNQLEELMNLYSEETKGVKKYKVNNIYGSQSETIGANNSQLNAIISKLNTIRQRILAENANKNDYQHSINVWAVLIVTVLPMAIIIVSLMTWWLLKTKKRKVAF